MEEIKKLITIKKGAIIEDNLGERHVLRKDYKTLALYKQEDVYICENNRKFNSGLESAFKELGLHQVFFVEERYVVEEE